LLCLDNHGLVAPQIWNMMPSHLKNVNFNHKQLKTALKTFLFEQASMRHLRELRIGSNVQMLDLID